MAENEQTEIKEAAKKYVDDQLELLKKHGSLKKISKSEYNTMINQVVKATGK